MSQPQKAKVAYIRVVCCNEIKRQTGDSLYLYVHFTSGLMNDFNFYFLNLKKVAIDLSSQKNNKVGF